MSAASDTIAMETRRFSVPGVANGSKGSKGLELVGDAWGDPQDPPVFLLHGGGQTRHAWSGTAEGLARAGWYAMSVDLRGHGESDWDDQGNYHFEAFAGDVAELARSCEQPPVLVGASLGGISSLLAIGESQASLARALVLVDIATRMERRGVERIFEFMHGKPDGFESLEEAADAVAAFLPERPRPSNLEGLRKNLRLHPDGRYRWHWDPRFMQHRQVPEASTMPERLDRAARALRLPTLLVRGRMSDVLSEEGAKTFLSLVPHAEFADVSGAGHMVAGDRNDVFTDAVASFLAGVREDGSREDGVRAEGAREV